MSQAEHDAQPDRRRGGLARPRHSLEVLSNFCLLMWWLHPARLRCGLGSYSHKGSRLLTLLLACSHSRHCISSSSWGHKFDGGRGGDREWGGGNRVNLAHLALFQGARCGHLFV